MKQIVLVALSAIMLTGCEDEYRDTSRQTTARSMVTPGYQIELNEWCVDGVVYYSGYQRFAVAIDKTTGHPKLCQVGQ